MRLFFSDKPEAVTWQAVVDDPSLETIQLTRPQAIKARHRPDNNFVAFVDGVVASQNREEEQFSEVRVDTDGEVASVSFDYVYVSNAKATNSGREKWLLVRTSRAGKSLPLFTPYAFQGQQVVDESGGHRHDGRASGKRTPNRPLSPAKPAQPATKKVAVRFCARPAPPGTHPASGRPRPPGRTTGGAAASCASGRRSARAGR